MNWTLDSSNPIVVQDQSGKTVATGYAGPSNLWTAAEADGDAVEMTMILGAATGLFRTNDSSLHSWTLVNSEFYTTRGGGGGLFFPLPGVSQNASSAGPTHFLQTDLPGRLDGLSTFVTNPMTAQPSVA